MNHIKELVEGIFELLNVLVSLKHDRLFFLVPKIFKSAVQKWFSISCFVKHVSFTCMNGTTIGIAYPRRWLTLWFIDLSKYCALEIDQLDSSNLLSRKYSLIFYATKLNAKSSRFIRSRFVRDLLVKEILLFCTYPPKLIPLLASLDFGLTSTMISVC